MSRLALTRRRVLMGVGGLGVVAIAPSVLSTDAVAYGKSMQVSTADSITLVVDWQRPTSNGAAVDVSGSSGAMAVSFTDVLPGDTGHVAFRVGVTDDSPRATLSLGMTAGGPSTDPYPENGILEPERAAGDHTDSANSPNGGGELQKYLQATVWYDSGFASFGRENGKIDITEPTLASGTIVDVFNALSGGVSLYGGDPVQPGTKVPLGLYWSLPADTGNVVQSDGVNLSFNFYAEQAGGST